jgi:hypothetical protein
LARRRYGKPSPAISTAGQSERPRDPQTVADEFPLGSEPTAPSAPAPDQKAEPEPAQAISSLKAQIDAQRAYAEQQQAQHNWHNWLVQYLGSLPGLTPHKFYYLHSHFSQNPQHLTQQHWDVLKAAHQIALERGVKEDSPEYFQFLDALMHQHAATPAALPMPPPMPEPRPQPMTHIDIEKTEGPEGEPEEAHIRAEHVSAPPSRGAEHYSVGGEYEPSANSVRLSKAEREHAAAAR